MNKLIQGAIDTHFHIGPEFVRRKCDMESLLSELKESGAGVVIKNHCYPTTPIASAARKRYGVRAYGSVVLNYYVGGINKYAITAAVSGNKGDVQENSLDKEKFIVWMPTVHAAAHLKHIGWDFDPAWGVDERYCNSSKGLEGISVLQDRKLTPETLEVLKTIKDLDLVLATGHLSNEETRRLVEESNRMGLRRIILTHPFYKPTSLTIAQQKGLSQLGAFVEHTYGVHLIDKIPLEEYVSSIQEVGAERTILSTDLGQDKNIGLAEGFSEFIEKLMQLGVTEEQIRVMIKENPRKLLD